MNVTCAMVQRFFEAKGPEDFGKEYENVSVMLPRKNAKDYTLKKMKGEMK